MTSLVHPGRLPRRCLVASRRRPRSPRGGGLGCRVSAWDIVGYHGITWASMNTRDASPAPGRPDLNASLTGCRLKEWLKGGAWPVRAPARPPEAPPRCMTTAHIQGPTPERPALATRQKFARAPFDARAFRRAVTSNLRPSYSSHL